MLKAAENKDGNAEKNRKRRFAVAENADGKIHQNPAEDGTHKRLPKRLRFKLAAAKGFCRCADARDCHTQQKAAQNGADRVAEQTEQQHGEHFFVHFFRQITDLAGEQGIPLITDAE